jgi:hypothetical protein
VAVLTGCGLREIDHRPKGVITPPEPDSGAMVDSARPPVPVVDGAPPLVEDGPVGSDLAIVPPGPDAAISDPSGAGVTINNKFVPRSKAVVFLHIGHSNMAGRATMPADLKPYFYNPEPQLWTYAGGGAFRQAKEPTAPDNQAGQAAGPGMALLHAGRAVAPDAFMISIGHGHSGSFAGYCANFRRAGQFYDVVMGPARELKGKVTFAGIFTMFGQSEHNAPAAQQKVFAECLKGIADEMRADLGEPGLPFIVGDYEMGISRPDIAPMSAFAKPIIAQIQMVPGKVTRSAIIATEGFPMEDDHHFNMAGHKMWADAGVKLLVDNGWAPWAAK